MWEVKIQAHKTLPMNLRGKENTIIEMPNWKAERFSRLGCVKLCRHFEWIKTINKCKSCGHEKKETIKRYSGIINANEPLQAKE